MNGWEFPGLNDSVGITQENKIVIDTEIVHGVIFHYFCGQNTR